jgi:hypothetical protein
MNLLGQLQLLLADLYDAPVEQDVHDFLITDPRHAASLQQRDSSPPTDEQLLIADTDDGVALSLYVDAAVLERLARRCPLRALEEANLQDYCTALEGVSHFHYVTWSAGCVRSVSLLELELQAEVDKYASALSLLLAQREGRFPAELFQRLFTGGSLLPHLDRVEQERYAEAHRMAARFCRRLEERFLRRRQARPAAMLAELRSFYRLGCRAKLRHAAQ